MVDGTTTTRLGAYGLVVEGRRILLCRIAAHIVEHAGVWTLPGGGLDFGEAPRDAMVREVREETGMRVRPRGVAGIDSFVTEDEPIIHSLRIVYFTELLGGELRDEVGGSTDLCQWHELDHVPSLPIVGLVESGLGFLERHR